MDSSLTDTIRSSTKERVISWIISIVIFILFLGMIIPFYSFIKVCCPFFGGVLFSWFVAVVSTYIVLSFVYSNSDKKEEYKEIFKEIFRQSESLLRAITVVVLFYMAIHLASKAFWTIGIPRFGEPYVEIVDTSYADLDFFNYISPQDIFLAFFVVLIIISIFGIAPYYIREYKGIVKDIVYVLIGMSFLLSILIACCVWKFPSIVPLITELAEATLNFSTIWLGKFVSFKLNTEIPKTEVSDEVYCCLFGIAFVASSVVYLLISKSRSMEIPKGCKGDFNDLLLVFCFLPAIIVASLVLSGDELVKFPNLFGHIVVGLLFISGFSTLMSMVTISFKQQEKEEPVPPHRNPIWLRSTSASLAVISLFSMLFLFLQPLLEVEIFEKALRFSVAIMILILLYGFLYEKLRKYQFTEWWRREWRPIAMIISILMIAIVSAIAPIDPETGRLITLGGIPIKLLWIFLVLGIIYILPDIIMLFKRLKVQIPKLSNLPTYLRRLSKVQIPKLSNLPTYLRRLSKLPMCQGMVLVKAETGPDKLKKVVDGLDGIYGVYQTMVVRGEYDVCLIVEGIDPDEIAEKILEIRKIEGVASTTTLTDIREFFDRWVR